MPCRCFSVWFSHHWSDLCGQCFHTAQDVYNFLWTVFSHCTGCTDCTGVCWVVEPLLQPVGAAHGTKLCSVLPWKNSAFESSDPRLGQWIQGVDNFCQKVVCVCCCFTAIRLCSWCYSRQVSVGWSNCAGARHLSDWFCGRLKKYRCSKYWLLALVCRTFHHQTQGNPRLTTWQMATPDNSPPDKWEPQAIHHQTNGNSRQFTTRQMGNPGSSPPDKWEPQAIHH